MWCGGCRSGCDLCTFSKKQVFRKSRQPCPRKPYSVESNSYSREFSPIPLGFRNTVTAEKDIQSHSKLIQELSYYTHFHTYAVSKAYDGEKIDIGLRVVRPYSADDSISNLRVLGTITDVKDTGQIVVQWDTATTEVFSEDNESCSVISHLCFKKILLKPNIIENIDIIGLGVVRSYLADDSISNLRVHGTIIDVKDTGQSVVQWDTATNEVFSDDNGQYNLLLFNNEHTEKIDIGLRVVRPYLADDSISNLRVQGTIIDVKDTSQIVVQWDTSINEVFPDKDGQYKLLLFNNEHTGVHHENFQCDGCQEYPLRGIRWECLTCGTFDLCTQCYMCNKHNLGHEFNRIISQNSKGVQVPPRKKTVDQHVANLEKKVVKRYCEGIIKGTEVQLRNGPSIPDGETYTYVGVCSSEKGKVILKDKNGIELEKSIHEIKLKSDEMFPFYPHHLPELKKCTLDYHFEIDVGKRDGKSVHNKVEVHVWHSIQEKRKLALTPCLYLIFANSKEDRNVNKFALMKEVMHFSRETKLPCYVMGQRVLFHSGSTNTACIHYKTCSDTIKELIETGFNKFERGDILVEERAEDEIDYFKQMAEHVIGEKVLPVIIFYSGKSIVFKNKTVEKLKIPIFRLKKQKHTDDVSVMFVNSDDIEVTKYETDTIKPWRVKLSTLEKNDTQDQRSDEYLLPSKISLGLDALVCNCLIGVCMAEDQRRENNDIKHTNVYYTALSMYLLTKEKWRIPNMHRKPHIKKPLDQSSLEYIYEQVITSEVLQILWYNQKSFVKMEYQPPEYLGNSIKLNKWESECYGLIFVALLQKRLWSGATQLIETGYIGIHHILVGCVILDDEINSWKTTKVLKEKLQRLKSAFTERAIRITSCIDDADKKIDNTEIEAIEGNKKDSKKNQYISKNTEEGNNIKHAARLLLNHGYLKDAINTENNNYVECDTVNNILNEMWYGTEKINRQTIFSLIVLAAVHLFVLPLLMINMEARPLRWFYKKYNLPFLKVIIHMLGFLVLLLVYAYMLLFDYSDDGITYTDCFIIVLIASFFVDEIKQVIIAIIRKKWKSYTSDWCNRFDWMVIIGYTFGMILRNGEGSSFRITSKCLLLIAFMLLCIRVLNFCCMTSFLGPKLVIIRKMIKDTVAFMIIMAVIMIWYSVSYYALLYPNSEFTWKQIEHILSNGYWVLFGELNLDGDTLTEPDCTFNRTLYESGVSQRCPNQLGLYLTPYLKAFYGLIAVVLLLNLLIAIYSDTFANIQKNSKFYWSKMQMCFLEEYSIKTVFPVHLQLLALPAIIAASWIYMRTSNKNDGKNAVFNQHPMCVRVFLYDTNYDMRLESTEVAEEEGAQEARGKIDIDDFDEITGENDSNSIKQDMQTEKDHNRPQVGKHYSNCAKEKMQTVKDDRRPQVIENRLEKIEESLRDLKEMITMSREKNTTITDQSEQSSN